MASCSFHFFFDGKQILLISQKGRKSYNPKGITMEPQQKQEQPYLFLAYNSYHKLSNHMTAFHILRQIDLYIKYNRIKHLQ